MAKPSYLISLLILLIFCTALSSSSETPEEPRASLGDLCDVGKYHEAMKTLPKEMKAWEEFTKKTGNSMEGASSYLYSTTMYSIAHKGDADWGKIFDDPSIPHNYKIKLLFEIAEARIGNGSAWAPWHTDVVILPLSDSIHSWEDVNKLLKKVLSEQ